MDIAILDSIASLCRMFLQSIGMISQVKLKYRWQFERMLSRKRFVSGLDLLLGYLPAESYTKKKYFEHGNCAEDFSVQLNIVFQHICSYYVMVELLNVRLNFVQLGCRTEQLRCATVLICEQLGVVWIWTAELYMIVDMFELRLRCAMFHIAEVWLSEQPSR